MNKSNNIDKSQNNYAKSNKQEPKALVLYDSIFIKFQDIQSNIQYQYISGCYSSRNGDERKRVMTKEHEEDREVDKFTTLNLVMISHMCKCQNTKLHTLYVILNTLYMLIKHNIKNHLSKILYFAYTNIVGNFQL